MATMDRATLLMIRAIQGGNEETASRILNAGASLVTVDDGGRTSLFYASYAGLVNLVQRMLELGANVHAEDNDGSTSLIAAIAGPVPEDKNGFKTACALLEAGANWEKENRDGYTPLFLAAKRGCTNVARVSIYLQCN